jgi:uncharacterized membrane protein (DUF2068 family)
MPTLSDAEPATSDVVASTLSKREAKWVLRRCGSRGHVIATIDDSLQQQLSATTGTGQLLRRCIRCGDLVPLDNSAIALEIGSAQQPAKWGEVPLPLRGSHGRKFALLRVLSVERVIRALGLLLAAAAAFDLAANHDIALAKFQQIVAAAGPLAQQLGIDLEHFHLLTKAESALALSDNIYVYVGSGLTLYALLQLVEAFGLWRGRRWAEYLTVVATTLFVPLELYELINHPTVFKGVLLFLNLVAVGYLLWKGRLFGIRGGHGAWLAEVRDGTLPAELLRNAGRDPAVLTSDVML